MESESFTERKTLEYEITKGMEQVKRFRASSSGNQEVVLERMLASYEEALLILEEIASEGQGQPLVSSSDTPGAPMSVCQVQLEDPNNVSDPSQDNEPQKRIGFPARRSISVEGSSCVHVTREGLDDGYPWKKYGQKDILGYKYPRCYYRCANRLGQRCRASKTLQRSSSDPSIYDVTYFGKHTCSG